MKKVIVFFIVLFTVGQYSSSHAFIELNRERMKFYTSAKLGYSGLLFFDVKDNVSQNTYNRYLSSAALGLGMGIEYKMTKDFFFRLELEYLYRTKSESTIEDLYINAGITNFGAISVSSEAQTILSQVYLDWYIKPEFALYANVGFGVSFLKFNIETPVAGSSNYSSDFAWSTGVGFLYRITKNIVFDTSVRYMGYSTTTQNIGVSTRNVAALVIPPFGGVDVILSVRYNF